MQAIKQSMKQKKSSMRWKKVGCLLALLFAFFVSGCSSSTQTKESTVLQKTGTLELSYATQFQAEEYGNCFLVTIGEDRYFLVPKDESLPQELPSDVTVLRTPLTQIYLASSSCMDLYRGIDALSHVRFTGTKESDWYMKEARDALEDGTILYAGKYNLPDYEMLLEEDCSLAIENLMISHNPEVKEQLENLGIPVLIEKSSLEDNPLGRMEWIKLHGLLTGKLEEAETYFEEQAEKVSQIDSMEAQGKTVAFFYLSSNGAVNVRTSSDYVSEMIRMAGGTYIFDDLEDEDSNKATMNIQFEEFYASAKDADYLVYNATIGGEIESVSDLTEKNALFADFKAVKNGNVWCAKSNLFQQTTGVGDMILDFHNMLSGKDADFTYLVHLD